MLQLFGSIPRKGYMFPFQVTQIWQLCTSVYKAVIRVNDLRSTRVQCIKEMRKEEVMCRLSMCFISQICKKFQQNFCFRRAHFKICKKKPWRGSKRRRQTSMVRGYRSWFQDLINVWTVPATILKNNVMYRQFIHSVAFVN
jgi:hypothetical protein